MAIEHASLIAALAGPRELEVVIAAALRGVPIELPAEPVPGRAMAAHGAAELIEVRAPVLDEPLQLRCERVGELGAGLLLLRLAPRDDFQAGELMGLLSGLRALASDAPLSSGAEPESRPRPTPVPLSRDEIDDLLDGAFGEPGGGVRPETPVPGRPGEPRSRPRVGAHFWADPSSRPGERRSRPSGSATGQAAPPRRPSERPRPSGGMHCWAAPSRRPSERPPEKRPSRPAPAAVVGPPAAPADAPAPPEQASVAEAAAPTPERSAAPGPAAPAAGVAPAASAAEAAGGELRVSDPQPEPERAAEAAACPALRSPESGFRELFVALTSSIARVGYYAVGHPGYAGAARELSEAAARALRGRGELTFARRCGVDDVTLSVQSAAGTSEDLDKALVPSVFEAYGGQLSEVFVRRRLVSLTLKERIDEAQLRAVVELLSGPEITVEQMRQEFLARGLREVSVLFDEDLLGRGRGLPWLVDLCISRIARDLRALPILRGLDDAALRDLRKQLLVEVIRPLTNARQVQIMLDNADLINDAVRHHAGDAQVDMLPQLVDALAGPMCVLVTKLVLADIRGQAGPSGVPAQSSGAGEANRRLVELMVGRFARERSDKSDAVLRELRQAGLLRLEDLPEELQIRLLADDLADDLVADPKGVLAASLAMADDASRGRRHAILEHAVEVLAGHGEVVALGELVRYFQKLAEGGSETDGSRRLARRALDRLDSARTLRPTAEVALNGDRPAREAALHVLSASGPCAAQALCKVRAAGALEPAARARFVAVVRELGRPAVAALASELGRDDLAADDALAEDLLRAVPPVEDEGLAALVSPYLKHEKPALRRAALEALVSLRRAASRSELLDGLSDADDAVRSAAIRGLRQIRGIDGEAVAALLGLIAPERHGSLDLRIMAAAALGDADKPARAAALSALCRLLDPPKKSFVARLLDRRPEGEANPVLVETMCRALLRIGGERGAEAVRKRATAADPELRARLLGLIAG